MKALVGAFNQEKALVGAFSVIVQPVVEPMDQFTALISSIVTPSHPREREQAHNKAAGAGGGAGCRVSKIILVPAGDQGKCFHEGKYFLKPDMGAFLFLPRVMKCEVRLSMSRGYGERRS